MTQTARINADLPLHLHLSHMPVESPSVGNGFFLFFEQLRGLFRGRRFEAFVSHFVVDVVFKGQARLFGVYDERVFALFRKLGLYLMSIQWSESTAFFCWSSPLTMSMPCAMQWQ